MAGRGKLKRDMPVSEYFGFLLAMEEMRKTPEIIKQNGEKLIFMIPNAAGKKLLIVLKMELLRIFYNFRMNWLHSSPN